MNGWDFAMRIYYYNHKTNVYFCSRFVFFFPRSLFYFENVIPCKMLYYLSANIRGASVLLFFFGLFRLSFSSLILQRSIGELMCGILCGYWLTNERKMDQFFSLSAHNSKLITQ